MKKPELIELVACKAETSKSAVAGILDVLLESIVDQMKNGEDVDLYGFGKFMSVEKTARESRNPKTGEKVYVPAHNVPKFKFSNSVKKIISNK